MYRQRNGRQLILVGIVVIVLVLLAAFLISRGGGGSSGTTAQPEVHVVVALQSIPSGTTITPSQVSDFFTETKLPQNIVPFGAYKSKAAITNLIKSTGCQPNGTPGCTAQVTTTQTIYQNLPVVSGMFSTLGQFRAAAGPAFQIPYGYVAIAVNFSATNSVLGSINAGDDVDLIASLTGAEGTTGSKIVTQTQYVMNDLRVISVNGPPAAPAGGSNANAATNGSTNGGSLLVLVRYQQALIIQHLKDFGGSWAISVVLRSSKETDIPHFKTLPVTGRWFFIKQSNHFDFTNPY